MRHAYAHAHPNLLFAHPIRRPLACLATRPACRYAALMGSGYGFVLSGILFIVWVVIGKPMGYSDDWWLIIGTTTGVIGTFNAAVLRFTLQQEERTLDEEYDRWAEREG